ncbi:hypothetical protein [Streptococcus thoraltensis]|uniref:hypothetical protein n=1 Tax=Streptococcus thoraltensis TaxID=55085 RepID=UPI001F5A95E8|nr:hypothetical protein [Streptococcus thoraltensis]
MYEILKKYDDLNVPLESVYGQEWLMGRSTKEEAEERFRRGDHPKCFLELNEDEQRKLLGWCSQLEKIKTYQTGHTSYGLKHKFEYRPDGFYITNGQFKGAMLIAGFEPKNKNDLNWVFAFSKKSLRKIIDTKRYVMV